MIYDINITDGKSGLVSFIVPDRLVAGPEKLLQQVMILLFSDDGDFIDYAGGGSVSQTLDDTILSAETSRIKEAIYSNAYEGLPPSESLDDLVITAVPGTSGSAVGINISVTTVDGVSTNTVINI